VTKKKGEPPGFTRLSSRKEDKRRQHGVFMPWSWSEAILRDESGGKAVFGVALHIRYEAWKNRKGADKAVKLANGMLELDGVSPDAKCDALRMLERLGLIKVEWRLRKSPIITAILVEPP